MPENRDIVAVLYPPQGIQAQMDKIYLYNPDAGGVNIKEITATGNIEVVRDGTSVELRDKTFVFEFDASKAQWEVNHNLNKKPTVTVVDSAETVMTCAVEYVDANNIIITFNAPFKGTAYLN